MTGSGTTWRRPWCSGGAERQRLQWAPNRGEGWLQPGRGGGGARGGVRALYSLLPSPTSLAFHSSSPRAASAGTGRHDRQGLASIPAALCAFGQAPAGLWAPLPRLGSLHPLFSSLLPSQVGSSVGPERGRARPPRTMSGSDTAPFLSQADDTDDGPVPGTPGLPGSMGNSKSEDPEVPDREGLQHITGLSPGHSALIVAVLCYINLLNYMDRFTVAGTDFWEEVRLGEGKGVPKVGLPRRAHLESSSQASFQILSSSSTSETAAPASSRPQFWLLLLTRGLVGVGEASYSTIAPTLIADLFVADQRSRMLSVFYFAIPVGSGLGYIAGSKVKDMAGDWHWALRVTPGLGVVAVLLLFLVVREPPRGAVERHSDSPPLNPTSWWADLRALARNPSFILSSLGFTAVAFVTGSLALWAPAFLLRSRVVLGETPPCLPGDSCSSSDSLIFGLITCLTGVLGVGLGVEISRRLRRSNPRADPLVCAAGLLGSAPFLFLSLACARGSIVATYIFIFIGETLLSMNWAVVADILLYVVIPTRRSTAEAFQIVLSHLLGDAGSPYLVGLISDRLRRSWPPSFLSEFRALQFSLMLCAFVGALGGAAFLGTAIFIEGDRRQAQLHVQGLLREAGPTDDRIVVPRRGRSTRVPVSSVLI
uniref:SPNS lysolipid transporter 1, lysophospholipid n=1 Tax=Lynx canadensis TaxID=61383 RepID=A0A667IQU1_LYNCA